MMPTPDEHLGEWAELYALGTLDAAEADGVNAHASACADCAALIGGAERAVMLLALATVPAVAAPTELARRIGSIGRDIARDRAALPARSRLRRWGALAASVAVILGAVAGVRGGLHLRDVVAQDDVALAVIANSHFKHATLLATEAGAPVAKVLWAPASGWIYVIVDSATCACRVSIVTASGERNLGIPLAHATTATFFANGLPPVQRIELQRGGKVIESVALR